MAGGVRDPAPQAPPAWCGVERASSSSLNRRPCCSPEVSVSTYCAPGATLDLSLSTGTGLTEACPGLAHPPSPHLLDHLTLLPSGPVGLGLRNGHTGAPPGS